MGLAIAGIHAVIAGSEFAACCLDAAIRLGEQGLKPLMHGGGAICDAVSTKGEMMEPSARIWPQTEAIRLLKDYGHLWPEQARQYLPFLTVSLITQFLPARLNGGWFDHLDCAGMPLVNYMPASSLYHIYGAARCGGGAAQRQNSPAMLLGREFMDLNRV
jgi:mannose-6-phosphate isomerase